MAACLAWVTKAYFYIKELFLKRKENAYLSYSRSTFKRGCQLSAKWILIISVPKFSKICQSTCVSVHPSNVKFSRPASHICFRAFLTAFFAWDRHKRLLWQWITYIFTVILLWMTNLRLLNIVYVALLCTVKQGYICNEMYDQ